jgi:hypothetical protein
LVPLPRAQARQSETPHLATSGISRDALGSFRAAGTADSIERTLHTEARFVEHVCVNHRRRNILVSQ